MNAGEAEKKLKEQLLSVYDKAESANIAAIVMLQVTGLNRMQRVSEKDKVLSAEQLDKLSEITRRLSASEPVQYVLGEAPFAGLNLYVNNAVLIPRPETEELVEWIVQDVTAKGIPVLKRGETEADETDRLKIIDVGTGSGCIALALKNRLPKAEVWGCDVSDEALNIARRNGSQLDIRVDFQGTNFLDEAQQKGLPTVDIVVSNPPYIPKVEAATLHQNVVKYEPALALFVPDEDALIFYKALARFGQHRLYKNGIIYCEIHEDRGNEIIELFKRTGYTAIEIKKDMQGKDRMIKAVRP